MKRKKIQISNLQNVAEMQKTKKMVLKSSIFEMSLETMPQVHEKFISFRIFYRKTMSQETMSQETMSQETMFQDMATRQGFTVSLNGWSEFMAFIYETDEFIREFAKKNKGEQEK